MKKNLILITIGILLITLVIWYLISPIFVNDYINESSPISDSERQNKERLEQLFFGEFKDADSAHKVSGQALILKENNKTYLRLEDFESTNGPDLKVYLATDNKANDYVSLGDLKGNIGNQNYEISQDVDLEKYNRVLIWDEKFSILFGSAKLY